MIQCFSTYFVVWSGKRAASIDMTLTENVICSAKPAVLECEPLSTHSHLFMGLKSWRRMDCFYGSGCNRDFTLFSPIWYISLLVY